MIQNKEKCYHLVVTMLSALLGRMTSFHDAHFYCLNCLHSFTIKKNLNRIKRYRKIKFFCSVLIPSKNAKILKFNKYHKSDKVPATIYADLECKNNPLQQK